MRPAESFLSQPVRSLQTMLRVIAEADGVSPPVIPDGIYGPQTMAAVSYFQKQHGLRVTGVTDQAVWDAVVAVYEPALIAVARAEPITVLLEPNQILRHGDRHPVLFLAQAVLTVLSQSYAGIPAPEVTGILDAATADALEAFQSLNGIAATGKLDRATWQRLALQYPLASSRWLRREER